MFRILRRNVSLTVCWQGGRLGCRVQYFTESSMSFSSFAPYFQCECQRSQLTKSSFMRKYLRRIEFILNFLLSPLGVSMLQHRAWFMCQKGKLGIEHKIPADDGVTVSKRRVNCICKDPIWVTFRQHMSVKSDIRNRGCALHGQVYCSPLGQEDRGISMWTSKSSFRIPRFFSDAGLKAYSRRKEIFHKQQL